MPEQEYTILADPSALRIGCVLFQAAVGATVPRDKLSQIPWTADTMEGMKLYKITDSQLDALIERMRGA